MPEVATGVQALFVHEPLLYDLISDADAVTIEARIAQRARVFPRSVARAQVFDDVVVSLFLGPDAIPELAVRYVSGALRAGDLVQCTQAFYFRREDQANGVFHGKLDVDDSVEVRGRFSRERTVSTTGDHELSGRKRLTMLAWVQDLPGDSDGEDQDAIVIRPVFIGWRIATLTPNLPPFKADRNEVFLQEIDSFARAHKVRPKKSQLAAVAALSEDEVIAAFADIIGEPFIPGHSPAENSDLYTNRLRVGGLPVSAAFAFKGPGMPDALKVRNMGSNGDQGIRLANEPAELLVVQHHREVLPAVRALMGAVAREKGKRFAVIDGGATAAILAAYGKLE